MSVMLVTNKAAGAHTLPRVALVWLLENFRYTLQVVFCVYAY